MKKLSFYIWYYDIGQTQKFKFDMMIKSTDRNKFFGQKDASFLLLEPSAISADRNLTTDNLSRFVNIVTTISTKEESGNKFFILLPFESPDVTILLNLYLKQNGFNNNYIEDCYPWNDFYLYGMNYKTIDHIVHLEFERDPNGENFDPLKFFNNIINLKLGSKKKVFTSYNFSKS